jgi:hypothetical protein
MNKFKSQKKKFILGISLGLVRWIQTSMQKLCGRVVRVTSAAATRAAIQ